MSYFSNFKTIPYDLNGDGVFDTITDLTNLVGASPRLLDHQTFYSYIKIEDGERPDQLSQRLYGTPQYHWVFMLINSNLKNVWNDWPKSQSQLHEYCQNKYKYLAAVTEDDIVTVTKGLAVGQQVEGQLSQAKGTIKEIHTNNKYIVIERTTPNINFLESGENIIRDTSNMMYAYKIVSNAYAPAYHIDKITQEIVAPRLAGTRPVSNFEQEELLNARHRYVRAVRVEFISEFITEFKRELQ
jgi:hypothetical protein